MRRILTFMILIVCLAGVNASAQDIPAVVQFQQAHSLLEQADKKRDANSHNEAISLYSEAQTMYNTLAHKYPNWQTSVVKFRSAYCNDQIEAILKLISKNTVKTAKKPAASTRKTAAKSDPEVAKQIANARKQLAEGKHLKARIFLLRALDIEPDNPTVRLMLAIAQCQGGKHKDAIYILDELVKEDNTNAAAYTVLGSAHFALGQNEDAVAATEHALKLQPGLKEANFNMAQMLSGTDKEKAKEHYRAAVKSGAVRDAMLEKKLK